MTQEKRASYTKIRLEKALKTRLGNLTRVLEAAEVGGKGIDLVKEIKELHAIITSLNPEKDTKKQEDNKMVVVWGVPEDNLPNK